MDMSDSRQKKSALTELGYILWTMPLYAVPFAFFFGLLFARNARGYLESYVISLVFAYSIRLAIWTLEHAVLPRFPSVANEKGRAGLVREIAAYATASIGGAYGAALLLHFTLIPQMLGNVRSAVVMGAFTLLFVALFLGIAYAVEFHRQALERVRAEEELNMARRIQRSFLRTSFPAMPHLEVHALNISSREVSGDFYDVVPSGENAFLVAIADVSGKGVPAALQGSMLQASLRTQAHLFQSTTEMIGNTNRLLCDGATPGQFATLFLARIEEDTLRLTYSNAGHNFPIVFREDGQRMMLEKGGVVLGVLDGAQFDEGELTLRSGDRVVLYTDGISEAANGSAEMYGEDRLCALVESLPRDLNAQEIIQRIVQDVRGFLNGADAGDDMTLVVLRVVEKSESATR
jgi:serine phosphatase RsbU (regulator of sigma subunit)